MSKQDVSAKSEILAQFFGEVSERQGRASGFVQRRSKMQGGDFVKTLVLGSLTTGTASLNELIQVSEELGVKISAAGLSQRMNTAAVGLLEQLLAGALKGWSSQTRLPAKLLNAFKAVYMIDSTLLTLPTNLRDAFPGCGGKGSSAAAKVQLSFEYVHGMVSALEVVAGRSPDQKCGLPLQQAQPDTLTIFDLGYFSQDLLAKLIAAEAQVLCRWHTQTLVFTDQHSADPLDLLAYLRRQAHDQGELTVYLGREQRLKVRLVFQKVPDTVLAQRQRRAKRAAAKKGKTCSDQQRAWLAWSIFITTVPDTLWSTADVPLVYSLRWQVELLFKLFKSQARLDHIPPCRPQRFLCQLYARLLGILLFQWVSAPYRVLAQRELSLPKAFRLFQRQATQLVRVLHSTRLLQQWLSQLVSAFARFALKDKRKKDPSSLARLYAACP